MGRTAERLRRSRVVACLAAALTLSLLATPLWAQIAPTITTQPADASRSVGDSITLRVTASGSLPRRYQWQFKDADLPGATNATLVRANLTLADAGVYRVKVSNDVDTATSNSATLDVDPTFTRVSNTLVGLNQSLRYASWGDFDGDGWMDLFSTGGSRNYLYQNKGDGTFARVTTGNPIATDSFADYQRSTGIWADFNNDGHLDLVLATGGYDPSEPNIRNILYRGEGNDHFTRITTGAVALDDSLSAQPAWGDYDDDGLLDLLFACLGGDLLYHNEGASGFVRVSDGTLFDESRQNFSAVWMDQDGDGDLDLLLPGTPSSRSFLYANEAGDFSNRMELFPGAVAFPRGTAAADFDNDGDLDVIMVGDPNINLSFQPRFIFRNTGPFTFEEDTTSGIDIEGRHSYDTSFADYDNDGWLDVVFARHTNWARPTQNCDLYHNNGDGTFTRDLRGSIPNSTKGSIGAAWADLNNDGFQDLLLSTAVSDTYAQPNLFLNGGNTNHWLNVKLVGTKSNRSAIGAKVRIKATINGQTIWQMREIEAQGFGHQNDPRAAFGLGDATQVDELRIEWPSGQVTTAKNIPSKQFLVITEGNFAAWAAGYGLTGLDAAADADPDLDRMPNSVEDVLGGNPKAPSTAGLPTGLTVEGNFVFTFSRADASETPDIALTVQAGPDLAVWPSIYAIGPDTASSSPGVTVIENGASPDTINLTLPLDTAAIKFARLNVRVAP